MKIDGDAESICQDAEEFIPILREVMKLGYDQEPDYEHYTNLL